MALYDKEYRLHKIVSEKSLNKDQQLQKSRVTRPEKEGESDFQCSHNTVFKTSSLQPKQDYKACEDTRKYGHIWGKKENNRNGF